MKFLLLLLNILVIFLFSGCGGTEDVLRETTEGWIADLESADQYAEEVLAILQGVVDDESGDNALKQIQGMASRRAAFRETKEFIPMAVSEELAEEYKAASDQFKGTVDQIQQEIYRIRGSKGTEPVITDKSLMNRLTQAAF